MDKIVTHACPVGQTLTRGGLALLPVWPTRLHTPRVSVGQTLTVWQCTLHPVCRHTSGCHLISILMCVYQMNCLYVLLVLESCKHQDIFVSVWFNRKLKLASKSSAINKIPRCTLPLRPIYQTLLCDSRVCSETRVSVCVYVLKCVMSACVCARTSVRLHLWTGCVSQTQRTKVTQEFTQ